MHKILKSQFSDLSGILAPSIKGSFEGIEAMFSQQLTFKFLVRNKRQLSLLMATHVNRVLDLGHNPEESRLGFFNFDTTNILEQIILCLGDEVERFCALQNFQQHL